MRTAFAPLPSGLRWYNGVVLLATWFGCGRVPFAPGTVGALGALPIALLALQWGAVIGVAVTFVIFLIGVRVSTNYSRAANKKDPSEIVIDETAGQCLCLCFAPLTLSGVIAAFLLFRLFDIAKPVPIRWIENRFPDGWGIMLDDIMAAIYAGAVLLLLRFIELL
ncbi:MAG: phosphatidylglycerophosphatase A [Hyphomicrobiales bacterium]|nr:phosphatidylglycerophosphatase A [Hyphomicrobiales bacterium]